LDVTAEVVQALRCADYMFEVVALPHRAVWRHADFIDADGGLGFEGADDGGQRSSGRRGGARSARA